MIGKTFLITILISLLSVGLAFGREGMIMSGGDNESHMVYSYYTEDGLLLKDQWKQVWDNWYYFGEDGNSKQNTWFQDSDGKWYYFNEWSTMLTDTTTPDGYYVGADGVWKGDSTKQSVPNWIGTYIADDEQVITVTVADTNGLNINFHGYSEEGWYSLNYELKYANVERTQAYYIDVNTVGDV